MVRKFLRKKYRDYLVSRVVAHGEAIRSLEWERAVSGPDSVIDSEIERRTRRKAQLLDKLKEAS